MTKQHVVHFSHNNEIVLRAAAWLVAMMAKVQALRDFLAIEKQLYVPEAVLAMNEMMGLSSREHLAAPLPLQVDRLAEVCGLVGANSQQNHAAAVGEAGPSSIYAPIVLKQCEMLTPLTPLHLLTLCVLVRVVSATVGSFFGNAVTKSFVRGSLVSSLPAPHQPRLAKDAFLVRECAACGFVVQMAIGSRLNAPTEMRNALTMLLSAHEAQENRRQGKRVRWQKKKEDHEYHSQLKRKGYIEQALQRTSRQYNGMHVSNISKWHARLDDLRDALLHENVSSSRKNHKRKGMIV
ncbi:MAG: hypothetical protein SGPRY_008799 [Prymnesium sp.]